MTRWMLVPVLTLSLTACGGGGDDSGGPTPLPDGVAITLSDSPNQIGVGQSISLYAEPETGNSIHYRYHWRQVTGPTVDIANPRSPIAAFEIPESGNYGFEVTLTDASGASLAQLVQFTPTGTDDGFNVSRDHMVTEGNRVSLRVQSLPITDPGTGQTVWYEPENIQWQQVSGPAVSNWVNEEPELLLFTAPSVTSDTLLTFKATGTLEGAPAEDTVWVLVTAEPTVPEGSLMALVGEGLNKPGFARVQTYRSDSQWADALERCVYDTQLVDPCALSALPLIGTEAGGTPSLDQVLDRVLVSHPWMGEQFEAFLRQQEQNGNTDFRHLLSAVTAVVISYDVRPSFYWVVTGAIYLDPEDLWMTPWQRDTINEAPDYRSGFGSALQFLIPWRYTRNNEYASLYYPQWARVDRPMQAFEPDLSSLLYHELAHANDFFPRSTQPGLSAPTLWEAYLERSADGIVSDSLTSSYPLGSEEMFGLAGVAFQGEEPTLTERNYTPTDVTGFFEPDRASDFYAYSTEREDLAMLFEEAMMQHRFGILRDVAVTTPRSEVPALDLIVDWGQRGRIGEPKLANRLTLVLNALLPEVSGLVDSLDTPIPMRPGENWFDNIELGTPVIAPALAPLDGLATPSATQGRWHDGPRHPHSLPTLQ
ncbi:hypothetical protein [Ferrimonas balearica]|uniref:hypothetical protein n=1 Tax=Ferrimonas balearica TaxID=44012 RepID=UPI001C992F3C|nr:hypothetical protein [Ferrimonas balearica]MBY5921075.1 hypothetical protein [Ferrimonas balearica]MBY5996240.1 hypothetical protein [Ferrimonas balearica]